MGYEVLIGGWLLYFLLHSLMAATFVKRWVERAMGKRYRYYRLGYSVIATAGLIALLVLNGSIPAEYFFSPEGAVRYTSLVFTTLGVMLIQVSFRQYKLRAFLGFASEESGLRRDGVLGWIRHPIYSGLILVTVGFFLFIPNKPTLISCVCILLYLPIGMLLEERKLIAEYGDAYRAYCRDVGALIPRLSRLRGN